jgi:hypothetical protein
MRRASFWQTGSTVAGSAFHLEIVIFYEYPGATQLTPHCPLNEEIGLFAGC